MNHDPVLATSLDEWAYRWVDMHPHIATLTRLAREASTIVEFGVREGVSTWALLDGLPADGQMYSVDIVPVTVPPRVDTDPRWTLITGDDMDPEVQAQLPAQADLIFIDSSHQYEHTVKELAYVLTLNPSRIVLHDYAEAYPGVIQAVDEFCVRESWRVVDVEQPFGLATVEP